MPIVRRSSRRSWLPAVAKTCAPALRAMAIAACPTPPVAEWIRTRSPGLIRPRSCRLYQAVAYAVDTAAAATVVTESGSGAASLASQVTNVLQPAVSAMTPTRSPILWSVTPSPTAVTRPAKSTPSPLRCPSAAKYFPNARSTSAKLTLAASTATSICPACGGWRFAVTNSRVSRSPGVRMLIRIPSCSGSTAVVLRSSGRSGLCRSRATYHEPCRQAVESSSDPLSNSPATAAPSVWVSTSIWVGLSGGCSAPITRNRPVTPPWSRLISSPEATLHAPRVTTYKRGGSPSVSGSSRAMPTSEATRLRPRSRHCESDSPTDGAATTTTPVNPPVVSSPAETVAVAVIRQAAPCAVMASRSCVANTSCSSPISSQAPVAASAEACGGCC